MSLKKNLLILSILLSFLFVIPSTTHSFEEPEFITLVNPVRISSYTKDPLESLSSQYEVVLKNNLSATWLFTHDVLKNEEMTSFIKEMDEKQEFGIFLEARPALTGAANIEYNETYYWHHATSLFLSGYTQEERIKLIEVVFETFKEEFGYYPTSVGSWWTDSFSLSYIKDKYGVTANLTVADQFSTDGYQVWGQYWSAPYYPSKYHSGIPAASENVKLGVVNLQWAPRDPINGYKSSLYSTQDYSISRVGLDIDYFEKLLKLYGKKNKNSFGQITVGLEGDLEPETYKKEFAKQLELISSLNKKGEYKVTTMKDFSDWYMSQFPDLSPSYVVESGDLLEKSDIKVIWYQSPRYRIGMLHDYSTNETKIFDFRTYHEDLEEPYYKSPNKEFELSIYVPSYFDEVGNPKDVWLLELGKMETVFNIGNGLEINFENGKLTFNPREIEFTGNINELPRVLSESEALLIEEDENLLTITPGDKWLVSREGLFVYGLTEEATHLLNSKRVIVITGAIFVVFLGLSVLIIFSSLSERKKFYILTLIIVPFLSLACFWYSKNVTKYYVNQGEVDALYHLSVLPYGRVLVYDNECLGCEYHSEVKPAVFANKRDYVKKYSKHPIIYNASIFEAKDRAQAKEEFDKLDVDYIYVVKYEDYIEKTPFSPGDLGIEKIYDNANAEIWVRK